ncbi:acyl-CoA dehydrogenase family protein [Bordetella genomosp. 13]|uniref:Pimeloyl-CoA dehydrogenase small subunit n=1 Tax=Bordetella genomosp. 13 TaxID=463040 RepID=A0A1W6Z6G2_9BORD|nr:acyl-CoA dehydrogenase [Bordetella genomosp. 13]ARP92981.1 hypothetical protein CAL15_00460 [Bordetella genomosp. 13]
MDFRYTEEQTQFADALGRWLQKNYGFEHRQHVARGRDGASLEDWHELAELGVFALTAPERVDGFDGDSADVGLIMRLMGRHRVLEPVLDTLMGIAALKAADGHDVLLGQLAAGQRRLSCAWYERSGEYRPAAAATRHEAGWRLDGQKNMVLHAAMADVFLASARLPDGSPALYAVPARTEGLSLRPYPMLDGTRAADLLMQGVVLPDDALVLSGEDALQALLDLATAALCAEGVGVMESMNEATFEYMKTRRQFGEALGSFQALRHRCVDMHIAAEQARVLTHLALQPHVHEDPAARAQVVSAAKVSVNKALRFIGQNAVHLHGGIGLTDELPVSHDFRRATLITKQFGDTDRHLSRFATQPAFMAAA